MIRVGIVANDKYSPWQQVYALVGRLADFDISITSTHGRVGSMLKKASEKHGKPFDYLHWKKVPRQSDVTVFMYMEEGGNIVPRYSAKLFRGEVEPSHAMWYFLRPDNYPLVADAIQSLVGMWNEYGRPGDTKPSVEEGIQEDGCEPTSPPSEGT